MIVFKSGEASGTISHVKPGAPYRFALTSEGSIYISRDLVAGKEDLLVEGARVELSYKTAQKGLVADAITSVRPPEPEYHRAKVKFYLTQKGYGFLHECPTLPGTEIFFHATEAEKAGVIPWEGQELEFVLKEKEGKFRATGLRPVQQSVSATAAA